MKVQGIGGAFLYADDAEALAVWYRDHLGIDFQKWGNTYGFEFPSSDLDPTERKATTTWSIFQAESPVAKVRTARLNYRVTDLDEAVAELEASGISVERSDDDSYGRFAWCHDPEGNRIELWEPPKA